VILFCLPRPEIGLHLSSRGRAGFSARHARPAYMHEKDLRSLEDFVSLAIRIIISRRPILTSPIRLLNMSKN